MEINYNFAWQLGDYLDKLKETILLNKNFQNTEFYRNNHLVLSKILFLA
jgi:hypothetical protein